MDTIDIAARLLHAAERDCVALPDQVARIVSEAMAQVVALPKTTEQAERVIRLVILRLNVLATQTQTQTQTVDDVWAIARRAKASTQSA
jgi:hypothetical protein